MIELRQLEEAIFNGKVESQERNCSAGRYTAKERLDAKRSMFSKQPQEPHTSGSCYRPHNSHADRESGKTSWRTRFQLLWNLGNRAATGMIRLLEFASTTFLWELQTANHDQPPVDRALGGLRFPILPTNQIWRPTTRRVATAESRRTISRLARSK